MANLNFTPDLELGKGGEKHVALELISKDAQLIKENNNKDYDLKMLMPNGVELTFEVKTDVMCKPDNDTGNMFIEFESWDRKTGVKTTKADYYVYYYPHFQEMWFIKTQNLKDLIEKTNFRIGVGGDPGSFSKGYLVSKKWYGHHFKMRKTNFIWES